MERDVRMPVASAALACAARSARDSITAAEDATQKVDLGLGRPRAIEHRRTRTISVFGSGT